MQTDRKMRGLPTLQSSKKLNRCNIISMNFNIQTDSIVSVECYNI